MTGQLVSATIVELKAHPPFDGMAPADLEFLASRLKVAYFAKGEAIVGPAAGVVTRLYIVKKGSVRSFATGPAPGVAAEALRTPGECFPIGALMGKRATQYDYSAAEDTFVYELDAIAFAQLLERSAHFRAYCTDYLASLVEQSRKAMRAYASESMAGSSGVLESLGSLLMREPVSCPPETSIRDVLATMRKEGVGSVVIAGPDGIPAGIFTQPDAVFRVALGGVALSSPVSSVMTANPVTLPAEAPRFEAALLMARHGIRHIVVVRDGRLSGVVSERDLFALQRVSLRRIAQRIRGGTTIGALRESAERIKDIVHNLVAQGLGTEQVTQVISSLNDLLVEQLARNVAGRRGLEGGWCWLALGSEGRSEQTLATDQDNALILAGEGAAAPSQGEMLAFADEINRALDACGFPLCRGDIMARNPKWCLTLAQWKEEFSGWIRNPVPQALLESAIFFDFRSVVGDARLAGELRLAVVAQASRNKAFLRAMAENALQVAPPLGLLRNFVTDDTPEFRGTIDLKKFGVRPFVDAARVFSLAAGESQTSTVARIRTAGRSGSLPRAEADSAVAAFLFLQSLRLRHQFIDGKPSAGFENRVAPAGLNELDRRVLREAFRQQAKLQERLRMDYAL